MKGIMKMIAAIVLLTLFFQFISSNGQAISVSSTNDSNYIVVDINGNGDYTSIQQAINNAIAGSTIFVKIGQYPEIINIKKQITITGENKEETIINPVSDENKYAINIGYSYVEISDLSITNSGPGIYTSGVRITASNVKISNCNFYDNPVGIAIWTANNVIENCRFWKCSDEGIALLGTSYSDCNNNKIINCVFENNCDGVELQYSSSNTIENCKFYDNTHTGIDAIAESNNENIISNCEIYNNDVHGIYFSASSDNQIIDCTISDNKDGNIIERNNCLNNEIIGYSKNIQRKNSFRERILLILKIIKEKVAHFNSVINLA